jgi:leucine dehydrogenase
MDALQHEELVIRRGRRSGLPVVVAVHSTDPGPAVGGCRLWTYPDWRAGLADALRLSAAMTAKCAVAGLAHGGGKTVLPLPPGLRLDRAGRRDLMLDLGDVVEDLGGRYRVGEDVGTTGADLLAVRERTGWVMGLPVEHGGVGEPAGPTARGVLAAIRATCEVVWGDPDPAGRSFAVHGLGAVGARLARWLVEAGARVTAADIDPDRTVPGAATAAPDDLLDLPVDVLVPASLGGLITTAVAARLRCRAVVGPANNQLADPAAGRVLAERGITWAPDVVVNGGGAIYVVLREADAATHDEAMARVEGIGDTVRDVLREAERTGHAPGEVVADRFKLAS